jgi:hypothetical protein
VTRAGALAALGLLLSGCGGGLPLLHPAQALPQGEVRAEAGFSANVAVGDLSNAVDNARAVAGPDGGPPNDPVGATTYTKGVLVLSSVGPGLAPIAGARVGIGWTSEGGLVYTGRAVRADMRKSITLADNWALSIGVGGSSILYGRQPGGGPLEQLHGWGADVPLLVGYSSDADLYQLWVGARAGWEQVDISELTSEPKANTLGGPSMPLSATRYWGGGLLGLAVGFRHVHVAVELDVAYATISGTYNGASATVGGVTLAPASALWWDF